MKDFIDWDLDAFRARFDSGKFPTLRELDTLELERRVRMDNVPEPLVISRRDRDGMPAVELEALVKERDRREHKRSRMRCRVKNAERKREARAVGKAGSV